MPDEKLKPRDEIDEAITFLKRVGHDVQFAHIPPPRFGTGLRIWIDSYSVPVSQLVRLAHERQLAHTEEDFANVLRTVADSTEL